MKVDGLGPNNEFQKEKNHTIFKDGLGYEISSLSFDFDL